MKYDIYLQEAQGGVYVTPLSAAGMFWLQAHFADEEWDIISSGELFLSQDDAKLLAEDILTAELTMIYRDKYWQIPPDIL